MVMGRLPLYVLTAFSIIMVLACGGSDNVSPTTPPALQSLALTNSSIEVSWDESLDNVGIDKYQVRREGAFIANATGLSYLDTGLLNATQYCYTVYAIDPSDNVSDSAGPACATTFAEADIDAPSQPTGMVATAMGSNSISVSWTNSVDDHFVYGYSVFNTSAGESFLANVTDTTYLNNGLVNSTLYCYEAEAFDSSGNRSARSNQDCAITPE
jgi:chitodextrinase